MRSMTCLDLDYFKFRTITDIVDDLSCSFEQLFTLKFPSMDLYSYSERELNKANYIPRVTLGLKAYSTCGSPDKALEHATDIAFSRSTSSRSSCVIGPEWSSEAAVVSKMLGSMSPFSRLPQIGYSTTASSLANRDLYPNFFRVVPPDDVQIKVMVELMRQLDWTYLAIYYENSNYGVEGVTQLETLAKPYGICVSIKMKVDAHQTTNEIETTIRNGLTSLQDKNGNDVGGVIFFGSSNIAKIIVDQANTLSSNKTLPVFVFSDAIATDGSIFEYDNGSAKPAAKGLLHINPQHLYMSEFANHWKSIFDDPAKLQEESQTNSWLGDLDRQCPQNCSSQLQTQSGYLEYAVRAAFTMAWMVKSIHSTVCGATPLGVCPSFCATLGTDFIKQLETAEIETRLEFLPFYLNDMDLVISFDNKHEIVLPKGSTAYEVQNYKRCQGANSPQDEFCFTKVGDFSSATKELTLDINSLRDYTADGSELQWPNVRKAQCPGGGICVDCSQSWVSDDILHIPGDLYVVGVAPVHNAGSTPLSCGDIRQGDGFDIAEAIVYATKKAQEQNRPIPGGSIGVILIDSCNDNILLQQKILSLHRFGLTLTDGSVIDINDKTIGYIGAFGSSISLALAEITSRLGYAQISYGSASPLLSDRMAYPWFTRITSSVVKQVPVILQVIQNLGSNLIQLVYSEGAYGEGAANTMAATASDYNVCLAQSIAVSQGNNYDLKQDPQAAWKGRSRLLKCYQFSTVSVNTSEVYIQPEMTRIDGLNRIWRDVSDVTINGASIKNIGTLCSDNARLDFSIDYRIDTWAPFAINTVYALLQGARSALDELCPSPNVLCDNYRHNTSVLVQKIKEVRLDLYSIQTKQTIFDSKGDGAIGYDIYNVKRTTGEEMTYSQIGRSTSDGGFEFRGDNLVYPGGKAVVSQCSGSAACLKCFPDVEESVNTTGYIVGIAILALLLVIVVCLLAFLIWRKGLCVQGKNEDHYDTVRTGPSQHYNYLNPAEMVSSGSQPSARIRESVSNRSISSQYAAELRVSSVQLANESQAYSYATHHDAPSDESSGGTYLTTTLHEIKKPELKNNLNSHQTDVERPPSNLPSGNSDSSARVAVDGPNFRLPCESSDSSERVAVDDPNFRFPTTGYEKPNDKRDYIDMSKGED
ncbi:hypothetical protein ScPMuIL_013005 [Solemya velum]